jgi:hypothetical protein
LVNSIKGDASEAIKNSSLFFPTPIAIGLPSLATIISFGFVLSKTAIA